MEILTTSIVVLMFTHLAATIFGAGSITIAEWRYFRALSDGRIDDGERAHLVALFFSLRFALVLVLLTDVAAGIALYILPTSISLALTATYWFEMLVILVLILVSWMRFHGRVPFWVGSAIAFTGWWYLVGISLGYVPVTNFMAASIGFIVSALIIAGIFSYARVVAHGQAGKV